MYLNIKHANIYVKTNYILNWSYLPFQLKYGYFAISHGIILARIYSIVCGA